MRYFEHAEVSPRPLEANQCHEATVLTYIGRGYSHNSETLVSTANVRTDSIETVAGSRSILLSSSQRTHGLYTLKAYVRPPSTVLTVSAHILRVVRL